MNTELTPGEYSYFVIDHFSRVEGRTIYIHFERCYAIGEKEALAQQISNYAQSRFLVDAIEYEEDDFFSMYGFLVPETVFVQVKRRMTPYLRFKQEYHFRYA